MPAFSAAAAYSSGSYFMSAAHCPATRKFACSAIVELKGRTEHDLLTNPLTFVAYTPGT